ncbi:MAG TPA: acyl-CoA reductase [Flavobacteriales bacterium]|nr:acyl-CoA reductase [Flavobacteriales bacterium]
MSKEVQQPFIALGDILNSLTSDASKEIYEPATRLKEYIPRAVHQNGWFDEANVNRAIDGVVQMLADSSVTDWISKYDIPDNEPKRIGVLLAGNLPLVGFHDFLCVLLSGNTFVGKLSSKDDRLLPMVADILLDIEPGLAQRIEFTDGTLDNIDAIIATGSDNTSRHIEYYFGKYPNIIRRNRNAIAVLDGSETEEELVGLGHDIFDYFGLGCRSVSKIYIPESYDLDLVFKGLFPYQDVLTNKKYGNNYDYYKAIYLMGQTELIENGFILLKEDQAIASPVAVLHYEYYKNSDELAKVLLASESKIQCVVAKNNISGLRVVPFGQAQSPAIDDYADGIDMLEFLIKLK